MSPIRIAIFVVFFAGADCALSKVTCLEAEAQSIARSAEVQPHRYSSQSMRPAQHRSRQYVGRTFLPGVVVKGSTGGFPVGKFTHGEPYYGGHGVYTRPRRDGFIGGERVRRRPE